MRRVVRPLEHVRLLGAIVPSAGLQHADLGAGQRQDVSGNAATGSGADYDYVVCFGSCLRLRHSHYFTPVVRLDVRTHRGAETSLSRKLKMES